MAQSKYIQNNFNGGEITPLMYGRTDLGRYFTSLSTCSGFIPTIFGSVYRRPGRRFIVKAMGPSRLIEFQVATNQPYLLEFGDQRLRFYNPSGQILSGGVPVEISTPYNTPADDLWDIKFVQQGDVMYLVHPNHPVMRLNRTSDTQWTLTQPSFHPPPTNQFKTDYSGGTVSLSPGAVSGSGVVFNASTPFFIAGDVGKAILSGQGRGYITAVAGATATDGATGATLYLAAIVDITDPFISTATISPGQWFTFGSPQSYFSLGNVDGGGKWSPSAKLGIGGVQTATTYKSFPVQGDIPPGKEDSFRSLDVGRYIDSGGAVMKIISVTNSAQVQVQLFSAINETFTGSSGAVRAIPISGGAWTIEDPAFSPNHGYPRCCAFLGSRFWLGGSSGLATTVYGSVVGDYENFAKGSLDDDGVQFTEDSGKFDVALWMSPYQGQLVTGNFNGEWAVSGGGGVGGNSSAITPSNISTLIQSLYGANRIQPIHVENQLLYVQRNGTRVLEFSFSIYSSVFASREMNLYSGVMNASGFKEMKYQQNPDRLVWIVCNDGELLAMTYKKDDDVWGWSRHPTRPPLDTVVSIGVMPSTDYLNDDLWMVTSRANNLGYFIEKVDPDLNTDAATKTDLGSTVTTVSGLGYIAQQVAAVIGDGAFLGFVTIPPSGTITLPSPSRVVEVGFNYVSSMSGLPLEIKGGLNSQGYLKRFVKLWTRLITTVNIVVNDTRVAFRGTDPMTQALVPFTGDTSVVSLQSDRMGIWTVVQDLPLPCTVVTVFGDVVVGEN